MQTGLNEMKPLTAAAAAAAAPKRRAVDGAWRREPERLSLTTLPRSVTERVLAFAVKDVAEVKVLPTKRRAWRRLARNHKEAIAALSQWRLVSRNWAEILQEIISQYVKRTLKVNLSHKTESDHNEELEKVTTTGSQVMDLRIALFGHVTAREGVERTKTMDWRALLRPCPNLQRLDLSKMGYLTRRSLGEIVAAASKYCLKMQALILPLPLRWNKLAPEIPGAYHGDEDDGTFVTHLAAALERWFRRGSAGGLRQLVVPHVPATSNEFLTAVACFCPNVEVLDGWKLTYLSDGWGAVRCDEEWRISLEVWELFCRSCTQLREFNWAVVPFSDAFFVPFGSTKKSRLTELALDFTGIYFIPDEGENDATQATQSTSETDNGRRPDEPATRHQISASGSSEASPTSCDVLRPYTSAGLCSLVDGLPFLVSLKVFMHPEQELRIDLDVFDDTFLQRLSKSTPYLEQLIIAEAGQYKGRDAIQTVTHHGLLGLAKMGHLSDIGIAALQRISADAAFGFIRQSSPIIKQRNVKIGVMQDFDKLVVPLLNRVAREPADSFADSSFALLVVNLGHLRGLTTKTCLPRQWEGRLRRVQTAIKDKHPDVRFQLTLERPRWRSNSRSKERYHVSKLSVFSTRWRYPDVVGGTFFRGDIATGGGDDMSFEWIVKCP